MYLKFDEIVHFFFFITARVPMTRIKMFFFFFTFYLYMQFVWVACLVFLIFYCTSSNRLSSKIFSCLFFFSLSSLPDNKWHFLYVCRYVIYYCVQTLKVLYNHIEHTHKHIYIIYVCIYNACVCMCVCVQLINIMFNYDIHKNTK